MKIITFTKYEGLGNDFIIIDESQHKNVLSPTLSISQRISLCNREEGIGADGVITILSPKNDASSIFMHVTNSDGSVPENCGNGLRCVGKWLCDNGHVLLGQEFFIDTLSGPKKAVVDCKSVKVGLGTAKVNVNFAKENVLEAIESYSKASGRKSPRIVAYVELGNPHLILECEDYEKACAMLGPTLEKLPVFDSGVNVSFYSQRSLGEVNLRVFERGAGATQACGTGAGATVAALIEIGVLSQSSAVSVFFENGNLEVSARSIGDKEYEIDISGEAKRQFSGTWKLSE